jgi:hypothetical protein
MTKMDEPTSEGQRLISTWMGAQDELNRRRESLYRAQSDSSAAEKALVEWMLPEAIGAKPGEKIAIWAGDSLIQVEVGGVESGDGPVRAVSSTRVTVRFRGKHFSELG